METWECFYKNDATAKAETLKKVEEAIARKLNNERKTDASTAKLVKRATKLKLKK